MAHRVRRVVALVAASAILSLTVAALAGAPAGATKYDGGHYEGTDSFTYDFCGFDVDVDVTYHGVFSIREGKGRLASTFMLHDKFWYTEVHSANGKFFTISANGLFQETRAIPLGGTLFEFHAVEAGQPFVVRGMDGEVLLRDRGALRQTIVFDTLGDDEPGGVFVEVVDVRVAGPHPGFDVDPTEACRLLAPPPTA